MVNDTLKYSSELKDSINIIIEVPDTLVIKREPLYKAIRIGDVLLLLALKSTTTTV